MPWRYSGTSCFSPASRRVTDLNPGPASTFATGGLTLFRLLGTKLLFLGANGEFGVSDGTASGTHVIVKGAVPRDFPDITTLNGIAYFPFDDGTHGRELWRSDGTDGGTRMIRDTSGGSLSPWAVAAGTSHIYYIGVDGTHASLMQTDGTDAGTVKLIDTKLWTLAGRGLVTAGDTALFVHDDGLHGAEPWISDGTVAGTHMIANLGAETGASSDPTHLMAGSERLFFSARGESVTGIWSTDGTAFGTKPILPETTGTSAIPLEGIGNTLYVKRGGAQLWSVDGTTGAAALLKDFNPGGSSASILATTVLEGRLYLHVSTGSGSQTWTTDGTPAGTLQLTNFGASNHLLASLAGQTYAVNAGDGAVYALGSRLEETRRVVTIDNPSQAVGLFAFRGALYLFEGSDLWRLSGAAGQATLVKHIAGGSLAGNLTFNFAHSAAPAGGRLLFQWSQDDANQLWATDGTAEGTVMLRKFATGSASSVTSLVSLGAQVVFGVDDGIHGVEPWVSDGTEEGTLLLRDIHGSSGSTPEGLMAAGGKAYFSANDPEHGRELWQTDGTPAGTQLVADLAPGSASSSPAWMTRLGSVLYFSAETGATGRELWGYRQTGRRRSAAH
jgi:ELWxxDGT repeat protein